MYKSADFISVPFQYYVFAAATFFNIALDLIGVVGWTISACLRVFVREVAVLKTPAARGPETLEQIIKNVIAELRADLGADKPVGRIVGLVERELYLYALIFPMHGLITAVLLFKAFSGWLKLRDTPAAPDSQGGLSSIELMGLQTLVRYYSYAIGILCPLLGRSSSLKESELFCGSVRPRLDGCLFNRELQARCAR